MEVLLVRHQFPLSKSNGKKRKKSQKNPMWLSWSVKLILPQYLRLTSYVLCWDNTILWYSAKWSTKNSCFPKLWYQVSYFVLAALRISLQDLESLVFLLSFCHYLKGKVLDKTIWDTSTEKIHWNQYTLN